MKQKRTFVTLLLILAILCLGIGYAAISSVNLTISGNVSAIAADATVAVEFTNAEVQDGSKGIVTANHYITDEETSTTDYTKATINVSELTAQGDTATVVYTIENKADDIAATLGTPDVDWTNTEWFDVDCTLSGTSLSKNGEDGYTQTATVTVTLLKTPVSQDDEDAATDEITITINAAPVENSDKTTN